MFPLLAGDELLIRVIEEEMAVELFAGGFGGEAAIAPGLLVTQELGRHGPARGEREDPSACSSDVVIGSGSRLNPPKLRQNKTGRPIP